MNLKKILSSILVLSITLFIFPFHIFSEDDTEEQEIDMGNVSETFGYVIEQSLQLQNLDLDRDRIIQGIRNSEKGLPMPMTEEEFQKAVVSLQNSQRAKLAIENLVKAEAFLLKKKSQKGIKVLVADKLYYEVLEKGKGNPVLEHSKPIVNYTGQFIDGKSFGSTKEIGSPMPLDLSNTIPGIQKGLLGMQEGEKRILYIHPELGYGDKGMLPPNSLLIFEVEVVENPDPIDDQDTTNDE